MNSSNEEPAPSNGTGGHCTESGPFTVPFLYSFTELSHLILLVLSLCSAVLQIHILFRAYIHIKGKSSDKCLHIFLFSATGSDLILTAICYPLELAQKAGLIPPLPYSLNLTNQLLCWISLIASSFSLVCLNFDKLAYFQFPLRYSQYFTRRRALWISAAFWFFSVAYTMISFLKGVFICSKDYCLTVGMDTKDAYIYIVSVMFTCVLPTITSLVVAVYILKIMTAHQKQIKQVFLARMRTFYFVFMTTVFTALTLLPFRFVSIYRILLGAQNMSCSFSTLLFAFSYLVMLNSIVNPLLTCTILPHYRLTVKICRRHYQMQPSLRDPDSTRESI
ncbi:7TM GPCR domain containing protein [Aphelenchoides bicaudatus]|nr:7TM GPCR domain containing protein [Aphelenchoides bicaudatus]